MSLFTVSVSSLSATYSNDFIATSGSYLWNLGSFSSNGDGSLSVNTNAPFTKVTVVPTLTGLTALSGVVFSFNDTFNDANTVTTYGAVTSTGVTHIYGPPGRYTMTMKVTSSGRSLQYPSYNIGTIVINEIQPQASITVMDLSGIPIPANTTANSPETMVFCVSATRAGSYPIDSFNFIFDDATTNSIVSRYSMVSALSTAAIQGGYFWSPFFVDSFDPRNYQVVHIYKRNAATDKDAFLPTLQVTSTVTATVTSYNPSYTVGPLRLALKRSRKLIKSKMYGYADDLLLVFEDDTGHMFVHNIQNLKSFQNDSVLQLTF